MSDDVARAVGAADPEVFTIAGKECSCRPLGLRELTEIERECVNQYKRNYLKTYADNADLLGNGDGQDLLRQKMEEVATWDTSDLPARSVTDPSRLKITDELIEWMRENSEVPMTDSNGKKISKNNLKLMMRNATATALDSNLLSGEEYKQLTGEKPSKTKVGFVNWWITASVDGMSTMIWVAFRQFGVTKDEVMTEIAKNPTILAHLSRSIEGLTAPAMGNG